MAKPSEALAAKLEAKQAAEDLTEREFAALLGVSQGAWNQFRNAKTTPGIKFLAGIVRRYPDLKEEVHAFLEDEPGLMELWSQPIPA